MELFPVYIVQQVHPWLPDPEAQLARQDGAHLWLGIQNWREMLQCLNVVSVCGASSTLRCLCAFYVCNIFIFQKHWQKFSCMCVIFLFSKNIDKVFLISTFNSYVNWLKIVFALLYVLVDYYTIHLYIIFELLCSGRLWHTE